MTNEASRRYFEQTLQKMSDGYGDELLINGVVCRRSHALGEGEYHSLSSLSGALYVMRATYRERYIDHHLWRYTGKPRATLIDNLTFIAPNKDRMRYLALRQAGLPVGSGATEGACKSVVGFRTKRRGQRWHNEGVSAVLTLPAIHQSNRLPRFWSHLAKRYTASVEEAA